MFPTQTLTTSIDKNETSDASPIMNLHQRRRLQHVAPQLLALCQHLISSDSYLEVILPRDKTQELSKLLEHIQGKTNVSTDLEKKMIRSIGIIWAIDDVLEVRPDLSEEQAAHVLKEVQIEHNASIGVNWDFIDFITEELYAKPDDSEYEDD